MNIGVIGDVAETGFGRVTRELGKRFLEAGHDIRILAINFEGREGAVARVLKAGGTSAEMKDAYDRIADDPVLSRAVPAHINGDGMGHNLTLPFVDGSLSGGWKPDRLILVADPVASMYRQMYDEGALSMVPTHNYVPIEGADLSAFWRTIWEKVQPVAMTEFGRTELVKLLGRDDFPVISHGISDTFYRVTPERPGMTSDGVEVTTKAQAKERFGWHDKTVILRYDRYVPRKGYPEYFELIRRVISQRRDVVFVIHCAPSDEGGLLTQLVADLPGAYERRGWRHGQVVLTRAHDTFRGLPDDQLNLLVNAADIYASTTYSEGWGLTLAEAAACGVPVVATDFGPISEAVGLGGILVPPKGLIPTSHGHKWAVVDTDALTDAVMRLIDDETLRLSIGARGEEHVKRFDWDRAALDFLKLMEAPFTWLR